MIEDLMERTDPGRATVGDAGISNPSSTESVRQEGSAQFALAGSVPPHARAEAGTMARRVEPFAGWKLIVVAACELSTRNHRTTRGLL